MKLLEFRQNLKEEQAYLVWQSGVFLLMRSYEKHSIMLYDMGTFFAEIWYHLDLHQIVIIRSYQDVTSLKPYLDQITCSDLEEFF